MIIMNVSAHTPKTVTAIASVNQRPEPPIRRVALAEFADMSNGPALHSGQHRTQLNSTERTGASRAVPVRIGRE
jgi:hypothetical protein